jgi:gamma-glutamyltranspeptidase/glutathione hydrolase
MGRADRPRASRSVVRARHGIVAAAQPLAVEAGVRILRAGGSAADAAIACNAVLAVVEPCSCGLGGDLFAMAWEPGAPRPMGLDASGRAPAAATIADAAPASDGTIPLHSPLSWTVPGAVDGWFALHARLGRLEMREVLADATRIATEGYPVTEVIASAWARAEEAHASRPGFAEVFLPRGRAPREGELFANEALARTLDLLRRDGRDAFYAGPVAAQVEVFSQRVGGWLDAADLARNAPSWVEPVSTTCAGVEVFELPPPGQGIAALQMLDILEALGVAPGRPSRDDADWWHLLVEAKKLAFADRARFYADPAFARAPVEQLLSKEYARSRARLVDPARAAQRVDPGNPALDRCDTTCLAAADDSGLMISLIQSNYTGFGSGHAVPEAGFSLQNRGALFSLDASHPNALTPGKRPFHTIIPAMAARSGRPWLAFGVMGGDMQPQGHVQVLLNLLAGMNLQEAGDAPRFHHGGSSEPTGLVMTSGGELHLEPEVPARVVEELRRRGHSIGDRPFAYGGYQAVARDEETGCLLGATESRKDGCALGF